MHTVIMVPCNLMTAIGGFLSFLNFLVLNVRLIELSTFQSG